MTPKCTIGFVYNEPCPLSCDFCCHTKENVGPGRLAPGNVLPTIMKFSTHDQVDRFAFTGGDPFIYIKEIHSIMKAARSAGVEQPFHIVTSGYWAKDDQNCEALLGSLSDLGMDRLYVSYDLEHRKWVSEEQIYRIERACRAGRIKFCVFGVFWEEGTTVRDLLPLLNCATMTNESFVAPIGRARTQYWRIKRDSPKENKVSCRRGGQYDITIYPNGEAYPCCSGGFNKEAGLLLGNAFIDGAEDIIRRACGDFFVKVTKELGFDVLIEKARDFSGGDPRFR